MRRESRTAEVYAKRVMIPVDRASGVQFVRASWLQQFMRLKLGPSSTPRRVRQAALRPGGGSVVASGRIKATDPSASPSRSCRVLSRARRVA